MIKFANTYLHGISHKTIRKGWGLTRTPYVLVDTTQRAG